MSTTRKTFAITGMHCTSCAMTIDWQLEDLDGIVEAKTNYARGRTEVVYDASRVSDADILAAITEAGFAARLD